MQPSSFHYFPLASLFFLVLVILFGLLVAALQIGFIGYAYEKMGISGRWVFGILFLSLVGSYINIPIVELGGGERTVHQSFQFMGVQYVMPVAQEVLSTVLAINVGGAIIPIALSIYLSSRMKWLCPLWLVWPSYRSLSSTWKRPIEGKGIAVSIFVPPILAAVVAMILSRSRPRRRISRGTFGIRGRQPGHIDRCRRDESARACQLRRTGCLNWRSRNV